MSEARIHEQCMWSRTWKNDVSRLDSFGKPFRIFDDRAHCTARLTILRSCYKPWQVRQHLPIQTTVSISSLQLFVLLGLRPHIRSFDTHSFLHSLTEARLPSHSLSTSCPQKPIQSKHNEVLHRCHRPCWLRILRRRSWLHQEPNSPSARCGPQGRLW